MAPRGTNPPYTATGDVDAFFERIRSINEPAKTVDRAWVESYKFETGHPQSIPAMLKWLGVIDEQGMSTGIWNKLRVPATKEEALAGLVRQAYAPIFDSIDLAAASRDDVEGAFLQAYSIGDAGRHIACFLSLCRHAGIEVAATPQRREQTERKPKAKAETAKTSRPQRERQPGNDPPPRRQPPEPEHKPLGSSAVATVAVSVELPAEWNETQIHARLAAVAKALRDNGLA